MSQTQLKPEAHVDEAEAVVWYRNVRVLRVVGQIVAVIVVLLLLFWLFSNLVNNLNRQNIGTDFGFLNRPTQFQIPYDEGFNPRDPVWSMVLVGVKNTFLASFFGILIASLVGILVGVSRLSSNWLVARVATLYVETLRNIPPLVVIIFLLTGILTRYLLGRRLIRSGERILARIPLISRTMYLNCCSCRSSRTLGLKRVRTKK